MSLGSAGGASVAWGGMPLRLGSVSHDLTTRALVMGVLRSGPSEPWAESDPHREALVMRASEMVTAGADLIDLGGVEGGTGAPVGEEEELARIVPAVEALRARFDVTLSVDTWRARVLAEACAAGAVIGNDATGFADPEYLRMAAEVGATVVATHVRLQILPEGAAPIAAGGGAHGLGSQHPEAVHPEQLRNLTHGPQRPAGLGRDGADVVAQVRGFLAERVARAATGGVGPDRVIVDAGPDLGKSPAQALVLLRESAALADIGPPLLLNVATARFVGVVLGLEPAERRLAGHAATALGIARGCRIVRTGDVRGARRVVGVMEAVLAARLAQVEREPAGSGHRG